MTTPRAQAPGFDALLAIYANLSPERRRSLLTAARAWGEVKPDVLRTVAGVMLLSSGKRR